MQKILAVDDEEDICNLLKTILEKEGYSVKTCNDGNTAVELYKKENFDLVILDVMMEGLDGFSIAKEMLYIRKTPIIMLTALSGERDKLRGFEEGIEDYIVKPFSVKELVARVKVVLRRSAPSDSPNLSNDIITYKDIKIDRPHYKVFLGDEEIQLSVKEFDILSFFVQNPGIVFSRRKIIDEIWGQDYYTGERVVDWQIKLLRKKLGNYKDYIKSIHGVGYKFEA